MRMLFRKTWAAALVAMLLSAFAGVQSAQAARFKITSAVMAKGYSGGKTSGVTNSFKPGDRAIYCVLKTDRVLTNVKARFVWTAVKARSIKPNTKFLDKTSTLAKADIIWGSAALPRNWPTGSYKVDVYINGTKAKTLNYSIR